MAIFDNGEQAAGGGLLAKLRPARPEPIEGEPKTEGFTDKELLDLWQKFKKEAFDSRFIWERGWMRNIHYVNGRQWISYSSKNNQWRDVRLAKWVPKPVTNKIGEGVMALRAMFAAVNVGATVRPEGNDPKNVAVAALCDDYQPVLHEEHKMEEVLDEADFWMIVTGTTFLHTFLEKDVKHGSIKVAMEQCITCGAQYTPDKAQGECPDCGGIDFQPAISEETGAPVEIDMPMGKGVTSALSPFELVFPNSYPRFEDVPYVIRLRWRSKDYYMTHPTLKGQVATRKWSKAPNEQALQLFRSLPYTTDNAVGPFLNEGGGGQTEEDGSAEYEVWVRPCNAYPKGLVFRVLGDADPIILHLEEDEGLPGAIPYRDAKDNAIFTFTCATFEQRGGRVYGASPCDGVIQKQNQLNQLDSMTQMIVQRMANPLWLVPKGSEIEKFTGEPGLVVKWNPLTVGGNAKPERIDGLGPNAGLFSLRTQLIEDIEAGMGTFDVVKGSKPSGVEAFSAMQLLVERAQGRFTSAFKARGRMYKDWLKFALEIERDFGPEERTRAILTPARTWTQQVFKSADLNGSFSVIVEDGSTAPKTTLGIRAAIEHLNSLGFLDPSDPDQKYKVYQLFGRTDLAPSLDIHMQAALRKQQAFEEWALNDELIAKSVEEQNKAVMGYQQQVAAMAPPADTVDPATGVAVPGQVQMPPPPPQNTYTPLAWKPWYAPAIHKQEFLKWANSDVIVELLLKKPGLEVFLTAHLTDISNAEMMAVMTAAGSQPASPGGGAGMAMSNSNMESGGAQNAVNSGAPPPQ